MLDTLFTLRARVWIAAAIAGAVFISVTIAVYQYRSAIERATAAQRELIYERAERAKLEQKLRSLNADRQRAVAAAREADRRAAAARAELAELRRELAGGDCAAALQLLRRRQQQ